MNQDRVKIWAEKAEQENEVTSHSDDDTGNQGGRVWVDTSDTASRYRVGDKVYLSVDGQGLIGPYLIESVPSEGKYTLCNEDGEKLNDGEEVEEKSLTQA